MAEKISFGEFFYVVLCRSVLKSFEIRSVLRSGVSCPPPRRTQQKASESRRPPSSFSVDDTEHRADHIRAQDTTSCPESLDRRRRTSLSSSPIGAIPRERFLLRSVTAEKLELGDPPIRASVRHSVDKHEPYRSTPSPSSCSPRSNMKIPTSTTSRRSSDPSTSPA